MLRRSVVLALFCVAPSLRAQGVKLAHPGDFKPIVQYDDTVATCHKLTPFGQMRDSDQGWTLNFGEVRTHSKFATAIWDSVGHLRSYSEGYGDLTGLPTPIAQRGDKTTLVIDFEKRQALASNFSKGTDHGLLLVVDEALHAKNLGDPAAMIERMHRQCGAPAFTGTATR